MKDGSVRDTGARQHGPGVNSNVNTPQIQDTLANTKNTKPKVRGCLACEHGMNVNIGRKHTLETPTVTVSLWTVKFDVNGKVLKRHGH